MRKTGSKMSMSDLSRHCVNWLTCNPRMAWQRPSDSIKTSNAWALVLQCHCHLVECFATQQMTVLPSDWTSHGTWNAQVASDLIQALESLGLLVHVLTYQWLMTKNFKTACKAEKVQRKLATNWIPVRSGNILQTEAMIHKCAMVNRQV